MDVLEIDRPFPSEELDYSDISGPYVRWSMERIEVDGIVSERKKSLNSHYFMHLKTEINDFDQPSDTGREWRWYPNMQVAEKHWLRCNVVIPVGAQCNICGER